MRMEEKETLMYSIDKQILEGKKKYPGKGYGGYAYLTNKGNINVVFYHNSTGMWNALTQFETLMGEKLSRKIFDNFSFMVNRYFKFNGFERIDFTLSEIK
jgi:hypothetical protein